MKRIILAAGLIIAVSLTSFARKFVAEGKTFSALGNYKIELDDKYMTINGKQHKPFVITYENSNLVVRVAVDMDKEGKKYYVISDNLSVLYVANRNYFGVEKLSPELEKDGFKTSDTALNRSEYFHQKVITSGQSWRRDNTKLIAAFFPMLLNNVENVLAAR
jgi:DNA-binding beta-propeller fold protein YncE